MDTQADNLLTLQATGAHGPLSRAAARIVAAIRHGCRRYCEHVVSRVLPDAPLGGHDWFMDLSEAR